MKPERFKRTKSVLASSAIALVVAALMMGLSSLVLGPKSASSQRLGFDLTSSSSSFTITSSTYTTPSGAYPATSCSGTPALLSPNVTRCVVFRVHDNLKAAISVQSITTTLDTTNYPAPPADCSGTNLVLPSFSGSFNVTGGGDATSPGMPIELKDNGAPQTDCQNLTYHFNYTGSANYTEDYGTSTGVVSNHNPSTIGQSVTYTATVTASATASQDPVPASPTGTVTFKDNGSTICNAVPVTSTGTTTTTATCTVTYATTVGSPHPITASYVNTDGNFTGSTSGTLSQVVTSSTLGTSTALTSSPDPSGQGQGVTLTATVTKSSGTGTPTGTVTFHLGSPTGTVVGTGTLNASGLASTAVSSLAAGTDNLYAIYSGDAHFSGSTSPVRAQIVVGLPSVCASGGYGTYLFGNPGFPFLSGTNGNDFIYAFGASYWVNGYGGNDCIDAGDGNNLLIDGNGNDGVSAGNGSDTVIVGGGNDKVSLGNGADGVETGNGTDTVTVGNGSDSEVIVGNGNDTITVGTGSYNEVELGSGTDSVTIVSPGSHDDIDGGAGNEIISLGSGTYNDYSGQAHHTNICHLPKPPSSWHGTVAAYYHDTITNCTVVTP